MVIKNSNSENDNTIGQIFTPNYIAEFMVNNIIGFIGSCGKKPQTLSVLEPSVGEGIFLKNLLENNLFNITAYEMDNKLKETLLESYPNIKFKFENFLGSDPNKKFDLIVGNPPYLGQNYNADLFQDYKKKFPICDKYFVGNMDLFYYFIHLGIEKLNPGGILTFITTNYWITKSKKTGIKLLKPHVLKECYFLQYIDLSHLKLFERAKGQHNCIFVLQKKTEQEKIQKKDKNIEIIHLLRNKTSKKSNKLLNEKIFDELIHNKRPNYIKTYTSALTNRDLKEDESWNLIYPREVKKVVDKIENFCKNNGKTSLLKDYFLIRNGLILIKDSIFILNEEKELKIKKDEYFILIDGKYVKLTELEKSRLKKIYKSKSIKTYGYDKEEYAGYMIYFNKNEFITKSIHERNQSLKRKYPVLSKYIQQFENELKEILINAKENPDDFYFPRRGAFIRKFEGNNKENLIDLEPLYENAEKIFFKFISKENNFGYSNNSYYATSDTYFLWPKYQKDKIDYLIILAYLNSKIIWFLFKAKNISIKRSKTKLEQGLPIPNLSNFENKEKNPILKLIKTVTYYLIRKSEEKFNKNIESSIEKIFKSDYYPSIKYNELKENAIRALRNNDNKTLQKTLDQLLFQLFDLDENLINNLLNEYYDLQIN
ncbi:MAG: Eco57I restriction-modification methylase domain-containing protein [Candidatus Lokiarchaeota archaeon]|nr:Eco57I restriction-modification methylase domain-containing protein [Candidatus Lokiarchaeota archaeon]